MSAFDTPTELSSLNFKKLKNYKTIIDSCEDDNFKKYIFWFLKVNIYKRANQLIALKKDLEEKANLLKDNFRATLEIYYTMVNDYTFVQKPLKTQQKALEIYNFLENYTNPKKRAIKIKNMREEWRRYNKELTMLRTVIPQDKNYNPKNAQCLRNLQMFYSSYTYQNIMYAFSNYFDTHKENTFVKKYKLSSKVFNKSFLEEHYEELLTHEAEMTKNTFQTQKSSEQSDWFWLFKAYACKSTYFDIYYCMF